MATRNKKISGITIEIGGDTTKLNKALQDVNKNLNNTKTDLKDVDKLLQLDPHNVELMEQKQRALTEAVDSTKEKLETLKTAASQANEALANGDITQEQYDALQREIVETEQNLKSLETQAQESSVALQKITAVGEDFKKVGSKISDVGQTLTTTVTLPLAAVGVAGAKSFADVDKSMQLTNKTMGSTEEEAQMLNAAMKEAAANSTFGMSDAANATLNFARAGLKAEAASKALAPAMNLAAGEGGDLDIVSKGLVGTINAFHGSFEETAHYADVFAAACNNSQLDVNSLADSVGNAAPMFAAAGYNIEDLTLAMGLMGNANIDASQASNALKSGLMRLVSPAKNGAEALESLGFTIESNEERAENLEKAQTKLEEAQDHLITKQLKYNETLAKYGEGASQTAKAHEDLMKASNKVEVAQQTVNGLMEEAMSDAESYGNLMVDEEGNMRSFSEVLGVLGDKFRDLSEAEQIEMADKIFGKNRGAAWIALVNSSTDSIDALRDSITDCAGTTDDMAEAMMGGFGGSMEKLKSSTDVLVTSIGESLAPIILSVSDHIQGLVDKFNALTPEQQELIVTIGLIVAAIGPVLLIIGKLATGIGAIMTLIPAIISAISAIGTAMSAFGAILMANPIFLIVGLIVGIVAGIVLLYNKCEWFRDGVNAVWEAIKTAFFTAWDAVKEFFTVTLPDAFNAVIDFVKNNWQGLLLLLVNPVAGAFKLLWDNCESFRNFFINLWNNIKTKFTEIWDNIKKYLSSVVNIIYKIFTSLKSKIHEKISGIKETVVEGIQKAIDFIKGLPEQALQWGKDFIEGFIKGIKDKVSNIKDAVSGVGETIKANLHFSRPDEGPLRDYEKWMPDFMRGLADGIKQNEYLVKDALSELTTDMSLTLANGGSNNGMTSMLATYLPQIAQQGQYIVLDSGELVGRLAPRMNTALGLLNIKGKY